ncbi:MAG TPA: glycosyltransferase family 9 protein [Planctomycetota bacterium]|nr:glycosyltransferase family 9 protein [Planctomycetota bacterium]
MLGNVLLIRPGALGDALLTLPVLNALEIAGAASITILGTPASWSFMPKSNSAPRVLDCGSSDWLGLYFDGAEISKSAREILAQTQCAIVYLKFDKTEHTNRLNSFGIKTILSIIPPTETYSPLPLEAPESIPDLEIFRMLHRHAAGCLLLPLIVTLSREGTETAERPRYRIPVDIVRPNTFQSAPKWLAPSPAELHAARLFLESTGATAQGFFALHPGSGGRRKCWPADRFAQLTARISRETNLTPLVLFGPADDVTRSEFERAMPADVKWHALAHRPLRELFALLHSCRFYIGNDSGISHLAARATRTLAIFGPTDPEVWAPLGEQVRIIRALHGTLADLTVHNVFDAATPLAP